MELLTVLVAIITAIIFTLVGYFLGNSFPLTGRKQDNSQQSPPRDWDQMFDDLLEKIKLFFSDDDTEEDQTETESDDVESVDDEDSPDYTILTNDLSHIWYDKSERKLFAEFDGQKIDLDERLSEEQHSHLSFLLLDLQDKVGISAALRSAVAEREEEAFPEEDEVVRPPSLNPIKSFMSYVQSDVPELEEKEDTIPSQINQILQDKLKGTPLESEGITIGDWPERGVVFIVGIDIYTDIHEIPNSDIRHVIRESVKEWESQNTEE